MNADDDIELLRRELARQRTARKQAEELLERKSLELYQRNLELEREVADRRRAEQALQEQAAALVRSNSDLEQFAYVASHDLQAPLRTISGFAQLLAKRNHDTLDAESREFLGFIEDGSKRLHALIVDLLAFSRVSQSALSPKPVDLQAIVDGVCTQLQLNLKAAEARIVSRDLPKVLADPTQMSLLFQNLIDNGIKFRRKGVPPCVTITATCEAQRCHVIVADNGIGIPAEHAERVFTIFQRLHHADQYTGTGIGLPICKKIVERAGGRIWIEPAPEAGAAFHFLLPLHG